MKSKCSGVQDFEIIIPKLSYLIFHKVTVTLKKKSHPLILFIQLKMLWL